MKAISITEKVTSYQMDMIRAYPEADSDAGISDEPNDRYNYWQFPNIMAKLGLRNTNSSIIWVGFDESSHIYSLLFCMLKISLTAKIHSPQTFIAFKHMMYELGSRCLPPRKQKTLVQMLTFVQYTTDLSNFLNKYTGLEKLFIIIFNETIGKEQNHSESRLQQIKLFCERFSLIKFVLTDLGSGIFFDSGKRFHIIQYKECFFVVEERTQYQKIKKQPHLRTPKPYKELESKKFQYSTPRFIFSKKSKKTTDKTAKEVSVNTFDFGQQFSSLEKETKSQRPQSPSLIATFGKDQIREKPNKSHLNQKIRTRKGFIFQSLQAEAKKNTRKGTFEKISAFRDNKFKRRLSPESVQNPEKIHGGPSISSPLFSKISSRVRFTYSNRFC